MRSLFLLLLLAGCADCVGTYSEYLAKPWCVEGETMDCKQKSVVKAVNPMENRFFNAVTKYEQAKEKDAITPEIAKEYVESKGEFCTIVNSIE